MNRNVIGHNSGMGARNKNLVERDADMVLNMNTEFMSDVESRRRKTSLNEGGRDGVAKILQNCD